MAQHTVRAVRRRATAATRRPAPDLMDTAVLTIPAPPPVVAYGPYGPRPRFYRGDRRRPVDAERRDQVASILLIAGTLIGCALLSAYHSDTAAGIVRSLYAFLVG